MVILIQLKYSHDILNIALILAPSLDFPVLNVSNFQHL